MCPPLPPVPHAPLPAVPNNLYSASSYDSEETDKIL